MIIHADIYNTLQIFRIQKSAIRNMGRNHCCCVVFARSAKTTQQQDLPFPSEGFSKFRITGILSSNYELRYNLLCKR